MVKLTEFSKTANKIMPIMNLSFWEKESFLQKADVWIVGSGIVGLSTAICIKERYPNWSVQIAERSALPQGASTKNAGFACFGSVTELLDDLNHEEEATVWELVRMRWLGLQRLRSRVGDSIMDYKAYGNYEVFFEQEATVFEECLDKLDFLNKRVRDTIGHRNVFQLQDSAISSFGFRKVRHLIKNRLEGQIDTGKMMKQLLAIARRLGVGIWNGVHIQSIEDTRNGVQLHTSEGWELKARQVVVANNGFARQLLPKMDVQPARNQVLITKPIEGLALKGCFHYNRGYVYFRNVGNRVLLGGGRHLDKVGETTSDFGTTERIQHYLEHMLRQYLLPTQTVEIEHTWSGILGVGDTKRPIIDYLTPNIIVAVRMGGMGVAIGSLIGERAAELVFNH